MINLYSFRKNVILIKSFLSVGAFFFSLIVSGSGECFGELILTGSQITSSHWVYLPVVLKDKAPCQQTVCNGDFEKGPDGSWSITSSNLWEDYVIVDLSDYDIANHSGRYAAYLGGDPAEVTTITQRITVPADATQLDYWYWIASDDSCKKSYGKVYLDATPLKTYDLCYGNETFGWANEKIDLLGYRGKTMDLIFQARIDPTMGFFSCLLVDDVSILGTQSPGSLKIPGQTPKTRKPFPPALRRSAWPSTEKGQ